MRRRDEVGDGSTGANATLFRRRRDEASDDELEPTRRERRGHVLYFETGMRLMSLSIDASLPAHAFDMDFSTIVSRTARILRRVAHRRSVGATPCIIELVRAFVTSDGARARRDGVREGRRRRAFDGASR